jgi:uncharacterized protein (DUF1778 family)
MSSTEKRQISIKLRARPAQRELIGRASKVLGKTCADFVLEAVCREAAYVLLDQQLFVLDDEEYAAFATALAAPVNANPALRRLLTTPAPWE